MVQHKDTIRFPNNPYKYCAILYLLRKGFTTRKIAKICKCSLRTIGRAKNFFKKELMMNERDLDKYIHEKHNSYYYHIFNYYLDIPHKKNIAISIYGEYPYRY